MAARTAPIVGSIIFFVIAPGVVAGWIPYNVSRWRMEPAFLGLTAGRWVGGALTVGSFGILADSFARFALEGRGTPAPIAPTGSLVVSGLYRHVRNPMYLAVVGAILGQALLFANALLLGYAAVVWGLFHVFVMAYEEPTLQHEFGEAYAAYRRGVGRWWPRIRPWRP